MITRHTILNQNAQDLSKINSNSVNLVVTSPPYPMIEMWDEVFSSLNPDIKEALSENPSTAFELMHKELDKVWYELSRVVVDGCFVCINIGDATRKIGDVFQIFMNASRIIQYMTKIGFVALPQILWRKPTNSPTKFMGSGMLPAGAYVTLEHEHILIFRKGGLRNFKNQYDKINRRNSGFFWEERNEWFSDVWEFRGVLQKAVNGEKRERTAAYPLLLPLRLISMYSVYNDVILDPFIGTGTTSFAAAILGRNSIGVELDDSFTKDFHKMLPLYMKKANDYIDDRLNKHSNFVSGFNKQLNYFNQNLKQKVMTSQETEITFYIPTKGNSISEETYQIEYQVYSKN